MSDETVYVVEDQVDYEGSSLHVVAATFDVARAWVAEYAAGREYRLAEWRERDSHGMTWWECEVTEGGLDRFTISAMPVIREEAP